MFSIPKKYVQDKIVLLLLSSNVFMVIVSSLVILLRLGGGTSGGYFVQYRSPLGISAYSTGGTLDVVAFLAFAFVVLIFTVALSVKAYAMRKELAFVILAIGAFLLVLNIIVSNGLLKLH